MCRAYNRWLCERVLAHEPRIVSMLYLPFNDPEATYRTVKDFADKKGCVGFMVTSPRYKPVHDNAYIKTYALLEEIGKPIAFHAAYSWDDRALQMTNRFISVHALGFMWFNMIHMTNWVINGLPVRFPKLKVMWVESGLTWAASLMQRLDHSYMMRTSDAPTLKEKPSHYMKQMYYSTQPMEIPDDKSMMQSTFKCINADTQLVWSSDYPHWDFDLPSTIYDLPFLNETSEAQHPWRQRGAAFQSRSQAGEENPVAFARSRNLRHGRPWRRPCRFMAHASTKPGDLSCRRAISVRCCKRRVPIRAGTQGPPAPEPRGKP